MLIIGKITYQIKLSSKKIRMDRKKYFVTTEEEPLFDGAYSRFGKDLVVQHGFTTNLKGID